MGHSRIRLDIKFIFQTYNISFIVSTDVISYSRKWYANPKHEVGGQDTTNSAANSEAFHNRGCALRTSGSSHLAEIKEC